MVGIYRAIEVVIDSDNAVADHPEHVFLLWRELTFDNVLPYHVTIWQT